MALGAGVYSPFSISFRDKGGEIGTFGVYGLALDDTSWVANQALAATFVAKLEAATLGVTVKWVYGNETVVNPVSKAASASAQRENKLLVRYYDDTTFAKLTASIPTIDLPNLVFETDANDYVSKSTPTAISDLVTAWQAFVVNPVTGNLTIIESLEFVGKNS